jgi:universal stress protein E
MEMMMKRIRNILVIVDPTVDEHPSLGKAQLLAQRFDARLELFVCDTKAAREARLLAERARDPARLLDVNLKPMLERLARPLRECGVDVATECTFTDVLANGLEDHIKRTNADLVIKDTHHHSLLRRTLITNTDWHLIRTSAVSLLLTRSRAWASSFNIVAAVDPGHLNDKPAALDHEILRWGSAINERLHGSLHAVHAYVPLTIAASAGNVVAPLSSTLTPEAMAFEEKEKRKELQALTDQYAIPQHQLHLELGVASGVLQRKAEELNADLVVMGAIARRGLSRIFIGSTAERALEHIPCDVLVVKATGADQNSS